MTDLLNQSKRIVKNAIHIHVYKKLSLTHISFHFFNYQFYTIFSDLHTDFSLELVKYDLIFSLSVLEVLVLKTIDMEEPHWWHLT